MTFEKGQTVYLKRNQPWAQENSYVQVTYLRTTPGGEFDVVETNKEWPWMAIHVPAGDILAEIPEGGELYD